MKIIKSLEQLLYELMVWIVFYPLTLWRATIRPLSLMDYADEELDDDDEDRYSDTLSPPIFLAISLGLIHLIELAAQVNLMENGLLADDRNLIAFRLVAFALFPLMLSIRYLRARGIALDRKTLREPFYAQCFVAAPYAIGIDGATVLIGVTESLLPALILLGVSVGWYLTVQTVWFSRALGVSKPRGLVHALRAYLASVVVLLVLSSVIDRL